MKPLIESLRNFLFSRKRAYARIFNKDDPDSRLVLKDLAKFCRADKSTFHEDPRIHAVLEGRREVYLRIANHLNLSEDELWKLYGEK
jgi:hypothetical protein